MDIERINQLFTNGYISTIEHHFLISTVTEQKISRQKKKEATKYSLKAIFTPIFPFIGFLLVFSFSYHDSIYELFPALEIETKIWITTVTSVLGVIFYILAKTEIKNQQRRGIELANFGLGIAFVILLVIIPIHLLNMLG